MKPSDAKTSSVINKMRAGYVLSARLSGTAWLDRFDVPDEIALDYHEQVDREVFLYLKRNGMIERGINRYKTIWTWNLTGKKKKTKPRPSARGRRGALALELLGVLYVSSKGSHGAKKFSRRWT